MLKDFTTATQADGSYYSLRGEAVTFNGTPGAIWAADYVTHTHTASDVKRKFVPHYQERHDAHGFPAKKARTTRADILRALYLAE